MALRLSLSCEHGGNRIPAQLAPLFVRARGILATHRGFDAGALQAARHLQRGLRVPLVAATVSRLVVDLNRSPHHRNVLSRWTQRLEPAAQAALLTRYHRPHRLAVERLARGHAGFVMHVAVHSFTPVLRGEMRETDIGLLYDPRRRRERAFCASLQRALGEALPQLRVRLNYPYRGISDGLGTSLRKVLPAARYGAMEIEINQALVRRGGKAWAGVMEGLRTALQATVRSA